MIRLERLGQRHGTEILAGQDRDLAAEIIGRPWTEPTLAAFLERCELWHEDGPLQEFAAVDAASGRLLGGGGLNRLAPGLARGQAALTYWVLASERGRGIGAQIATALRGRARRDPGLRQAVLLIADGNDASRAVARRLGACAGEDLVRHPADGNRYVRRWLLDLRIGPEQGWDQGQTLSDPEDRRPPSRP
ncbi:GNAT family N-acetyltransferase [Brachybacterium sp.]|uniref:GNAT family N-acetyltransferase n=1 Tax=Brachybacterium sp. TaxID=1891286 RepID=UPI002ED3A15E